MSLYHMLCTDYVSYIPYILLCIILIIFIIICYIKIKFPFWSIQPVFHVYDLGYILFPPGIINAELPEKNKYTNLKNIQTFSFQKLDSFEINKFIQLIRGHYLQNGQNVFVPKKENVVPYFIGHNIQSFFTFYYEDYLLRDPKQNILIKDKKIVSVMTSRPIHIIINKFDKYYNQKYNSYEKPKVSTEFMAYYVDYLCVDKHYRKKGIAPQMIQTHYYNQRHIQKSIHVNLFKREEDLTGIVPLCVYSTYGFHVTTWNKPPELLPMFTLLEITPHNFHYLYDFIKKNGEKFDILIYPEITNLMELLKTKNIFIYTIMTEDVILCAYFYRKTCSFIKSGMEILNCFASINESAEENIFIQGFKISFWKTAEKYYFGFASIENISHNHIIIENIKIKTNPCIVSPTAYFFYNFAYPTFQSKKVFIIN